MRSSRKTRFAGANPEKSVLYTANVAFDSVSPSAYYQSFLVTASRSIVADRVAGEHLSHVDPRPKYYLTTPIYYANARPHVGSPYTTPVADTVARFKRMQGYDVAFLTGTDEHGENIARAAAKLGISPRELVDRNSKIFRDLWDQLGIGYTRFLRTPSAEHLAAVRRLLLKARDAGFIYKKPYKGRYCVFDNN